MLSSTPTEKNIAPPAFHVMTKPRGSICNLACKYCYFLSKEKLYPHSVFRMSDELLESYTRQYIQVQRTGEVYFAWQGGEPTLMGLEFFRRAVALQQRYRKPGMIIHNSLQTNAVLLNEEWAAFLRNNDFLVGVSLDGPAELHDAYRVHKGGQPTHQRVMQGLQYLIDAEVEFNVLCCVHAANAAYPLDVYRFLRDQVHAQFIQFIPIVERRNTTGYQAGSQVTERTVGAVQWGNFLLSIFDEWVHQDVGKVFVQLFDVCLGVWSGYPASLCVHSETCGMALALEHNGDLYACDHFVEPDYFLGNIQQQPLTELVGSEQQKNFGRAKFDTLPDECLACEVRFICNGGCPKDRIVCTASIQGGLNYLCAGYKAFFSQIDRPMRWMASLARLSRPPAEIMQLLTHQDSSWAPILSPIQRKRHRK